MAKNHKVNYDFCIPITLPINLLGKERVVTVDVFGQFYQEQGNLMPQAINFKIVQIDNDKELKSIDSKVSKEIFKILEENPLQVGGLVLRGIQSFAVECLSSKGI